MQEILTTALTTAAGTGGICFLIFKVWFENACAKQLETHKSQLSRDNELEIALFKHKLELAAAERNFRFSHVFEKTAEAIINTYRQLVELRNAVNAYTMSLEGLDETKKKELAKVVEEKWQGFETSFQQNKILIPKSTAKQIRNFSDTLAAFRRKYGWLVAFEKSPNANQDILEKQNTKIEKMMYDIPEILTALEDEFQTILGFRMDDKPIAIAPHD